MIRQDSGFALIVAISLMSFIILMLLSLSTLVSVELSTTQQSKAQLAARENARLALMIALGELQKHAGPDQRVTARAEILGDGNYDTSAKNWTGIWNSTNTGTPTAWLVTGMPTTASSLAHTNVEILEAIDSDLDGTIDHAAIKVPLERAPAQDGLPGRYGWWVSDEATKASIAAGRDALVKLNNAGREDERRLYEYQTPYGINLASVFKDADIDSEDINIASFLRRIQSLSELPVISDSSGLPITDEARLKSSQHDLTVAALGILENTNQGGLKRNLSDPDYRDSFLVNDELAEFIGNRGETLKVESGIPNSREAGKVLHSPRPIPTEIAIYVGIFHTQWDGKNRIRFHAEAEFMNPYSLPLKFASSTDTDYDQGLVVYFENLPTITISDLSITSATPTITEDLNNFASPNYSVDDYRKFINSWFEFIPTDFKTDEPTLLSGEVYQVLEPNPATQERGLARDFIGPTETIWPKDSDNIPEDNARIQIAAVHPVDGVNIIIVPYDADRDTIKNREPIYEIRGLKFEDFTITKRFKTGDNPYSRPTSGSYTLEDYVFAYYFRIRTDETDITSMTDIVTSVDLRDIVLDAETTYQDIENVEKSIDDLIDPNFTDPSFAIQGQDNFFSEQDQIMDKDERSHAETYRKSYLYDMPTDEITSVGQLSSVHIYRRKPRSIGSPWGEEYNEAFDRYYFSPKLLDETSGDYFLSNPWLVSTTTVGQAPEDDDANSELVVGAFNVNSTSAKAWEAVLSAPVLTPKAEDETSEVEDIVTRENAFFRLPQYQSTDPGFVVTDTSIKNPDNAFAQGIRVLDGNVGELQIEAMAQNIVSKIKERSEPFGNMEEFVNSGLIQEAINEVGFDKEGNLSEEILPINQGIHEYSNLYLTQSDILTKIAPFATTRTDTFVVRGYGEVRNSLSDEVAGTALCEAVIQRLPNRLDGGDPNAYADASTGGRNFRIMNFKWINEEF